MAVQVADRLVSQQRGATISPLDRIANKLVVYRARDAIVSIGFAGQAFIGNTPTDEWIAQLISGEANVRGPNDMGGVRLGRIPNNWDIGFAVRRIRDELKQCVAPGQLIWICVVGHQIGRHGLVRPLICELAVGKDCVRSFHQSPRHWPTLAGCISSIGIEIGNAELERIVTHLRDSDPPMSSTDIAEFLSRTIRDHEQPGVGPHTSAVIVPFPGSDSVRTKFFPNEPHYMVLRSPAADRRLEGSYSPWIVGPGIIKAPTFDVGGMTLTAGGIEIEVEGASPPARGILAAMGSVDRFVLPRHLCR